MHYFTLLSQQEDTLSWCQIHHVKDDFGRFTWDTHGQTIFMQHAVDSFTTRMIFINRTASKSKTKEVKKISIIRKKHLSYFRMSCSLHFCFFFWVKKYDYHIFLLVIKEDTLIFCQCVTWYTKLKSKSSPKKENWSPQVVGTYFEECWILLAIDIHRKIYILWTSRGY